MKCSHDIDLYCLAEEFGEAIKVGNLLGSLDLTVEGDVSKPLLSSFIIAFDYLTFSIQPYNPYVEELHIKLSKPVDGTPVQDEAMDTSSSSQVQNYYPLFTIDRGCSIMLTVLIKCYVYALDTAC